jgi:hypothetical protein
VWQLCGVPCHLAMVQWQKEPCAGSSVQRLHCHRAQLCMAGHVRKHVEQPLHLLCACTVAVWRLFKDKLPSQTSAPATLLPMPADTQYLCSLVQCQYLSSAQAHKLVTVLMCCSNRQPRPHDVRKIVCCAYPIASSSASSRFDSQCPRSLAGVHRSIHRHPPAAACILLTLR